MKVIEKEIYSNFLGYNKKVYIALPNSYNSNLKYPVIYMHDGQNLFFDNKSYGNYSWKVIETLERLAKEMIIVGVENGKEKRTDEYSPWLSDNRFIVGGGNGDKYTEFFIKELLPYIEKNYSVIKDKKSTYLVGSSMGAYISVYISIKYPQYFSKIGCFSLASYFNKKDFNKFINSNEINCDYFISVGTNETSDNRFPNFPKIYIKASKDFYQVVKKKSQSVLKIYPNFEHNERAWEVVFSDFVKEFINE